MLPTDKTDYQETKKDPETPLAGGLSEETQNAASRGRVRPHARAALFTTAMGWGRPACPPMGERTEGGGPHGQWSVARPGLGLGSCHLRQRGRTWGAVLSGVSDTETDRRDVLPRIRGI